MAAPDDQPLKPGMRFGRYRIVRQLGRGGMGAVYEAVHVELDKKVAIKTLLGALAGHADIRARFLREGQAASRIRHPHVVDIYDVGTHRNVAYLVMEYLEGEELLARVKREGRLEPAAVVNILLPVCAAMAVAHEEGVVHRDLKPANIFLARDRYGEVVPKVLDFGISKRLDDGLKDALTSTGALMGTPYYMSPEQAKGEKNVDARADQYSLGVILYQCLTGKRPIEGDAMYSTLHAIVEGQFAPPRSVNPAIPVELEKVVLRAMKTKPADRYPSVMALGEALYPFADAPTKIRWARQFDGGASAFDVKTRMTEVAAAPRPTPTFPPPPREALIVGETPLAPSPLDDLAELERPEDTALSPLPWRARPGELSNASRARPSADARAAHTPAPTPSALRARPQPDVARAEDDDEPSGDAREAADHDEAPAEAALAEPTGEALAVTHSRPEALRTHGGIEAPRSRTPVAVAIAILAAAAIGLGVAVWMKRAEEPVILVGEPRDASGDAKSAAAKTAPSQADRAPAHDVKPSAAATGGDDPAAAHAATRSGGVEPLSASDTAATANAAKTTASDTKATASDAKTSANDAKATASDAKTSASDAKATAPKPTKPAKKRVTRGANEAPIIE